MAVIERDLDSLVCHLRFPAEHRKRIRSTKLLERSWPAWGCRRTPHGWISSARIGSVFSSTFGLAAGPGALGATV